MLQQLDQPRRVIIVHEDVRAIAAVRRGTHRGDRRGGRRRGGVALQLLRTMPARGLARGMVKWLLEAAATEFVFYTQEDFDFVRPVPIARALELMAEHRSTTSASTSARRCASRARIARRTSSGARSRSTIGGQVLCISDRWYHQASLWRRDLALDGYRALVARAAAGRNRRPLRGQVRPLDQQTVGGGAGSVDGYQEQRRDKCRTFIWGGVGEPAFVRHTGSDRRARGGAYVMRSLMLGDCEHYASPYMRGVAQAMRLLGHVHEEVSIRCAARRSRTACGCGGPTSSGRTCSCGRRTSSPHVERLIDDRRRAATGGARVVIHDGDAKAATRYPRDISTWCSLALVNHAYDRSAWNVPTLRWPYFAPAQDAIAAPVDALRCGLFFAGSGGGALYAAREGAARRLSARAASMIRSRSPATTRSTARRRSRPAPRRCSASDGPTCPGGWTRACFSTRAPAASSCTTTCRATSSRGCTSCRTSRATHSVVDALERLRAMTDVERRRLRRRAFEHVQEHHSSIARVRQVLAAWSSHEDARRRRRHARRGVAGRHAIWLPNLQLKIPFQFGGRVTKYQHAEPSYDPADTLPHELAILRALAAAGMAPPIGELVHVETLISEHRGAWHADPVGAWGYEMADADALPPGRFSLEAMRALPIAGSPGAWGDIGKPGNVVNGYLVDVRRSAWDMLRWTAARLEPLAAATARPGRAARARAPRLSVPTRRARRGVSGLLDRRRARARPAPRQGARRRAGLPPRVRRQRARHRHAVGRLPAARRAPRRAARSPASSSSRLRRLRPRAGAELPAEHLHPADGRERRARRVPRVGARVLPRRRRPPAAALDGEAPRRARDVRPRRRDRRAPRLRRDNAVGVDDGPMKLWPDVAARGGRHVGDSRDRNLRRLYQIGAA
jgi:hypothetical protein